MIENKVGRITLVEFWSKFFVDPVNDEIFVVDVVLEVYMDCLLVEESCVRLL